MEPREKVTKWNFIVPLLLILFFLSWKAYQGIFQRRVSGWWGGKYAPVAEGDYAFYIGWQWFAGAVVVGLCIFLLLRYYDDYMDE